MKIKKLQLHNFKFWYFYIEMCMIEKWSILVFQKRIQFLLYERTANSKKPELNIAHDLELLKNEQKLNPDLVFRDLYFLDFLGLSNMYSELNKLPVSYTNWNY